MKRGRLIHLCDDLVRSKKRTKSWLTKVKNFRSCALEELGAIYTKLTNDSCQNVSLGTTARGPILATETHALIYSLGDGLVKYGPEEKEYPIFDNFLWPWKMDETQANIISKEVLILICLNLKNLIDLFQMRLVCKKWKKWIDESDSLWFFLDKNHPLKCLGNQTPSAGKIRTFYFALPRPKIDRPNSCVYRQVFMNLTDEQQVIVLASLYAPLKVKFFTIGPEPSQSDGVRAALSNTLNPTKPIEKQWNIFFKAVSDPLSVFIQKGLSSLYVSWDGAQLKSKVGFGAQALCYRFSNFVRGGGYRVGWIVHWVKK